MSVLAAPTHDGAVPDLTELDDAREALAYWEARSASLSRLAVRERREARELAGRWRARVTEAERDAYGDGLRGTVALMVAELRLPEQARHTGRQAVHRARQAAVVLAVTVLMMVVAVAAMLVALASVVFSALT